MLYLVAYDIPDAKRRLKLAKTLLDYGVRVQESVFECLIDKETVLLEMIGRIEGVVDIHADAVRILTACATCAGKIRVIGQGKPTSDPDVYII